MLRLVPFALALLLSLTAAAQTRRHTVVDYYKLLPKRFFEIDHPENGKERLRWLREGMSPRTPAPNRSVVDLKHDFLRSAGDGAQGRLDLAVFRYQGQETLAVFDDFEEGELSFWRLGKGRLREVTRSVFPFRLPSSSSVELPRTGTTIRVLRGNGYRVPRSKTIVGLFAWQKGRFVRVSR